MPQNIADCFVNMQRIALCYCWQIEKKHSSVYYQMKNEFSITLQLNLQFSHNFFFPWYLLLLFFL